MTDYDKKIRKIKSLIKNMVIENAALADENCSIQEKIEEAEVEREYLFNKLMEHEPHVMETSTSNGEKRDYKRKNSSSTSESFKPTKKKLKIQAKMVRKTPVQQPTFSLVPKPPCTLEGINIMCWGTILDRAYNTEHSIYPTNYKIMRTYRGRNFVCKIVDNNSIPLFQIHTIDDAKNVFSGSTPNEAFDKMQMFYPSNVPAYCDGESFFGLKNKRIRDFIKLLPNANRVQKIKVEEDCFDPHNYL